DEVLEHSGYPVGGVPPFNKISRILLDPIVQRNARSIAGGGDPDKVVELETRDILEFLNPIISDFSVYAGRMTCGLSCCVLLAYYFPALAERCAQGQHTYQ